MARLTQRLAAEQRAREVEVSERDRKITDLNRLLVRSHLEQMPDADASDGNAAKILDEIIQEDVLVTENIEDLQTALEQFCEIAQDQSE